MNLKINSDPGKQELFNPEQSAENLRQKLRSVNKMTLEIVEELFKARKFYGNQGFRSDLVQDWTKLITFEQYLGKAGLARSTAYSWLERYVPEQKKLLSHEELKMKKEIELQDRRAIEERRRALIAEYRKTGVKGPGWDKSLDDAVKNDIEFEKRKKEAFEERARQQEEERRQRAEERERESQADNMFSSILENAANQFIKKAEEREKWKDKIRVSDTGKEDSFMDAIMDYLDTLQDDNRRIEACNNIVKICRNISVQLQQTKKRNVI